MRDLPSAEELLDTARRLLRDEVLPQLPAGGRHAALMIANALAIARRQLEDGGASQSRELESLERIFAGERGGSDPAGPDAPQRRDELDRRLCRCIREGRADGADLHHAVLQHLLGCAHARVQQSNPRYLDRAP